MSTPSLRRLILLLAALLLLLPACAEGDSTAEEDTAAEADPSAAEEGTAADSEPAEADSEEPTETVAAEEGPVVIGAVLDITGAGAALGGPERDTIELLAEQLNADGGINGAEVEVIIRDNQSREDEAATQMASLLEEDVDIILGASRTGTSLAMRPLAEQAGIPMISLAANQAIVDGSEWLYKTAQNDSVVVRKILDWMEAEGYETLGLARDASAFGEGVADIFRNESGNPDIVAVEERFAPDATDFTAQMLSLRDTGADMNVIWGIVPAAATATITYRELGIETPVLHSHGIGNPAFLEVAGDAANGVVFPIGKLLVADELSEDDPQYEVITQFAADYEEAYGASPSTFAGHAWDGFTLAVQAIEEVGTDPVALRDYLETAELTGVSGVFQMTPEDHSGLDADALIFSEIVDGDWTLADSQPGS